MSEEKTPYASLIGKVVIVHAHPTGIMPLVGSNQGAPAMVQTQTDKGEWIPVMFPVLSGKLKSMNDRHLLIEHADLANPTRSVLVLLRTDLVLQMYAIEDAPMVEAISLSGQPQNRLPSPMVMTLTPQGPTSPIAGR